MGLLNELNSVNRTLQDTQQKELSKTQQKEVEKLKKQRIKRIFAEQLEEAFAETFSKSDIEVLTINLIKNKQKNIEIIKDCYFDKYNQKLNNSDIDYMDEFYLKFIQDAKKEYEYIFNQEEKRQKEKERQTLRVERQEEKRQKEKERQRILEQQRRQQNFNNFIAITKTISLILASPFILIMFFVWGICKNIK